MRASRKWVAVAIAFAAGSLALWPAGAGAAPIDTASDHAALVAYDSYVEGLLSSLPAAHVAVADYVSSISARCPDVLAPIEALPPVSVNGGAALAIGEELGEDLDAAAYPALRGPSARFAATLAQLRWSSSQTNRTMSGFVTALATAVRAAPESPVLGPAGVRRFGRAEDAAGDAALPGQVRPRPVGRAESVERIPRRHGAIPEPLRRRPRRRHQPGGSALPQGREGDSALLRQPVSSPRSACRPSRAPPARPSRGTGPRGSRPGRR